MNILGKRELRIPLVDFSAGALAASDDAGEEFAIHSLGTWAARVVIASEVLLVPRVVGAAVINQSVVGAARDEIVGAFGILGAFGDLIVGRFDLFAVGGAGGLAELRSRIGVIGHRDAASYHEKANSKISEQTHTHLTVQAQSHKGRPKINRKVPKL